ncbi:MAG TPA: DUF5996 family protein [Acidimicrobiales bacterium]|nr:DUF5996 family protein [Acidimicrobiales bacterium]
MEPWPTIGGPGWERTWETVHMWTQVVGKVRLALEPAVNHWWQVPLYVSARGLTTALVHGPDQSIEIEFDFRDHELAIRSTTGERRSVALEPRSVASFYAETMAALDDLGTRVDILARPVEVPTAIPFADDTEHASYDAEAMTRYWLALVQADRLLRRFRARFLGKASPVHFFWGAFDLATTRFSGRPAPPHGGGVPNCPDWVMHEAYSHELSSCGFWPGGSEEGSFYAYAYPEPDGFADWPVPGDARYAPGLGEFILPYRTVRTAPDPDALVLEFLQATYDAAADLGAWDRASLERTTRYQR